MENKKKSNVGLIIVIVVVCVLLFFSLIGFGGYYAYKNIIEPKVKETTQKTTPGTTIPETNKQETTEPSKSSSSSKDAKESSKDAPLSIGEWGYAPIYAGRYLDEEYADKTYLDVPVRVTKVTRGSKVVDEVKKWAEEKKYKYEDPKPYTEWAIIDYEVDLTNVKFGGSLGTNPKVSTSIKGSDGGSIKHNGITYIGVSTREMGSSDYVKKPGVYQRRVLTQLPEGCTDYLIVLGSSYNGKEAFYKGE